MGTRFFQPKASAISGGGNMNMESRAINAGAYTGRAASGAANKDIAAAMALYKAHAMKPSIRSAAYPPGPKKV